jgi:hypothetical protein
MRLVRKIRSIKRQAFKSRTCQFCKKCHLLRYPYDDPEVFFYYINNNLIDYFSDTNESYLRCKLDHNHCWVYGGLIDTIEVEYIFRKEEKLRLFI